MKKRGKKKKGGLSPKLREKQPKMTEEESRERKKKRKKTEKGEEINPQRK